VKGREEVAVDRHLIFRIDAFDLYFAISQLLVRVVVELTSMVSANSSVGALSTSRTASRGMMSLMLSPSCCVRNMTFWIALTHSSLVASVSAEKVYLRSDVRSLKRVSSTASQLEAYCSETLPLGKYGSCDHQPKPP
jgi:hypothetical protein